MWRRSISVHEALEIITKRRPAAEPNAGFLAQLELYEQCDYQVDLRHKAVRRFLMSKTNILDGDSVDDMLLSYYPSPFPSPSATRTAMPPRLGLPSPTASSQGQGQGAQRSFSQDGSSSSSALTERSTSSEGTPSSSIIISSSSPAPSRRPSQARRPRKFSRTSSDGTDGRPIIDLHVAPESLPSPSTEEGVGAAQLERSLSGLTTLDENRSGEAEDGAVDQQEQQTQHPSTYPSTSLAQPSSVEVKVTQSQGRARLPGGVDALRGNESVGHSSGGGGSSSSSSGSGSSRAQGASSSGQPGQALPRPQYTGPKLRCKMCRRELASLQDHLIDHDSGKGQLAFVHKKRIAPGSAQASADTRLGIERPGANGNALSSQQIFGAQPAGPSAASDGQQQDGSAAADASAQAGPRTQAGRPILSAASLSASLPPHLAALRGAGRAPPAPSPTSASSPSQSSPQTDAAGASSSARPAVARPPVVRPQAQPQAQALLSSRSVLPSSACSSYFLEPLQWMTALRDGELAGRLDCPSSSCGAKLGSWDWAGMQCGCGAWITPAFALHCSKVDIIR